MTMMDAGQDTEPGIERLKDFFLARQPILNRQQGLVAYELLFRDAERNSANVKDDVSATASVIAHASELGLTNVIGNVRGFVNIDSTVLMSDFVSFLPPESVVLEILETVEITDAVVARVDELARHGYIFAVDDVVTDSPELRRLMPHVAIIKVDIFGMDSENLRRLSARLRDGKKKMLAEKVETLDQFKLCLELGFEYFQGYYFAKPAIMTGKKLSPSQLAILRIMSQLAADADNADIEQSVKHDAALGLMLLRLVNTPAIGAGRRIESLGQALMILGRRQLERWLQILLYAEPGKRSHEISPLLLLATTRGKLLELLAQALQPGRRGVAETAFTVGIMSLMEALFASPMENILEQIAVSDEVAVALLRHEGLLGELLTLVECIEHIEDAGERLQESLAHLNLSPDELCRMQVHAFEWSNSITVNVR
jgi:c-di-GMP phosphodiesterase